MRQVEARREQTKEAFYMCKIVETRTRRKKFRLAGFPREVAPRDPSEQPVNIAREPGSDISENT